MHTLFVRTVFLDGEMCNAFFFYNYQSNLECNSVSPDAAVKVTKHQ